MIGRVLVNETIVIIESAKRFIKGVGEGRLRKMTDFERDGFL